MTIELNKTLADAVCTAVTLGFIKQKPNTQFIYEKECESDIHEKLSKLINSLDSSIRFRISLQEPKPKKSLVVAKTQKSILQNNIEQDCCAHNSLLQDIKQKFSKITLASLYCEEDQEIIIDSINADPDTESKINKDTPIAFYGAYIGGLLANGPVKLIGPSKVYLYPRDSKNVILNDINEINEIKLKAAYYKAQITSDAIVKYLHGGNLVEGFCLEPSTNSTLLSYPITIEHIKSDQLFASLHGLINALETFKNCKDPCCELALSADTSKVASCIPCSIFAASKERPATATHFGRGDNWNLPPNVILKTKEVFNKYVSDCFKSGQALLLPKVQKPLEDALIKQFVNIATENDEIISEVYLKSLTYEDKFITRIQNTFNSFGISL